MKIYKEIPKLKEDTVISIGKFDGVHIGHATLLEELVLMSDLEDATSVAITFNPFTEEFFQKKSLPHLNTRGEIISEMDEIGYEDYFFGDGVCLIEWAEQIRELLPEGTIHIHIEKDLDHGLDYRRITIGE